MSHAWPTLPNVYKPCMAHIHLGLDSEHFFYSYKPNLFTLPLLATNIPYHSFNGPCMAHFPFLTHFQLSSDKPCMAYRTDFFTPYFPLFHIKRYLTHLAFNMTVSIALSNQKQSEALYELKNTFNRNLTLYEPCMAHNKDRYG